LSFTVNLMVLAREADQ